MAIRRADRTTIRDRRSPDVAPERGTTRGAGAAAGHRARAPEPAAPASGSAPGSTPGSARARDAAKLTGQPEVSYARAEAMAAALELAPLTRKIGELDSAKIKSACAAAERRHAKLGVDFSAQARALPKGATALVPIAMVRPGQVQISFENVRTKMLELVAKLDAALDGAAADAHAKSTPEKSLLAYSEALGVVVGPGGRYLVLVDGHHHIAGLKAIDTLVHDVLGDGVARGAARASWKPGRAIRRVHELFGEGGGMPLVPLHVLENAADMSERDFWRMMRGEDGGRPLTYLADRAGHAERVSPKTFGALEDNPFRYLASVLTGKVSLTPGAKGEAPALALGGAEQPVWLKVLELAPPFIEFKLARVLEDAFAKAGLAYDPLKPLGKAERRVARAALWAAKHDPASPAHDALKDVPVIVREVSRKALTKALHLDARGQALHLPKSLTTPSERRLERWSEVIPGLHLAR